jgi:hypothetical protein
MADNIAVRQNREKEKKAAQLQKNKRVRAFVKKKVL